MATSQRFLTASQDGHFGDREFVVACKGRPFTILTPTSLPTPTVTYMDHKLVTELKLRISDLQCSRLHYGSKKLRILGKVSTSVQCIDEGNVSGNLHMKALVVENLCEHFDVHSIADIKLNQMLTHHPSLDLDTSDENDEPTRSSPKKKKKKKNTPETLEKTPTSTPFSTPARENETFSSPLSPSFEARRVAINAAIAANTKKSPDYSIFESSPSLSPDFAARRVAINAAVAAQVKKSPDRSIFEVAGYPPPEASSIYQSPSRSPPGFPVANYSPSTNISSLCAMGGVMNGQLGSGQGHPVFYPDHGPRKCLPSCRERDAPLNCGYNARYHLPLGFQMCGTACQGAFCACLRDYSDYGYYG